MPDKDGSKKWVTNGYAGASDSKIENGYAGRSTYPKTDVRYWRSRIFKPVTVRGQTKIKSELFAIKLQYLGHRMTLSLSTANAEEAAQRARRMYLDLVAGGWERLLEKHRPKLPEPEKEDGLTFGEYVALVRSRNLIP